MLWAYLSRDDGGEIQEGPRDDSSGAVSFRPSRPFADLIYGAILMPKNTSPPRDSARFLVSFQKPLIPYILNSFLQISSPLFIRDSPSPFFFLLLLSLLSSSFLFFISFL